MLKVFVLFVFVLFVFAEQQSNPLTLYLSSILTFLIFSHCLHRGKIYVLFSLAIENVEFVKECCHGPMGAARMTKTKGQIRESHEVDAKWRIKGLTTTWATYP